MQLKFSRDRSNDAWRCCIFCHVRTGTIFLGIWHLVLHILALSVIAVILLHPEVLEKESNNGHGSNNSPLLPTPLSKVEEPFLQIVGGNFELSPLPNNQKPAVDPHTSSRIADDYLFQDVWGRKKLNCQDLNVGIAVTFCTFAITMLMVYGAVKGKPSYLMPFFCLQVFDFCISSLTMIRYFSYLPDVHHVIAANPNLPWQQELLRMDPQLVGLFVLLTFVLAMTVKAYFIGVVWNCYKYLCLTLRSTEGTIHYIEPDSRSGLLADLPDYETAINDPQYMKKPFPSMAMAMSMPPPYSTVVNLPPETNLGVPAAPAQAAASPEPQVPAQPTPEVAAKSDIPAV